MTLYFPPTAKITGFSAAAKPGKATVTITVAVGDPSDFGYFLKCVGELQAEQQTSPYVPSVKSKAERDLRNLSRAASPLLLTDQRGE